MVSAQRVKILFLVITAVSGLRCSSGFQALENDVQEENQFRLKDYEKTFRPSDYDPAVESIVEQLQRTEQIRPDTAAVPETVPPDTVQGFRVQLLASADIEAASQLRDSVSLLLLNDWVYVVYHTPYYKVRVGDFLSRIEANRMSSFLRENGFAEAWVVPDRVLKPPPPKALPRRPRGIPKNH